MFWPDIVNGLFEMVGGLMGLINVRRILRDKKVAGVSLLPTGFFTAWGLWNLFYYPSLNQWCSFVGGVVIVVANALWVGLAIWYTRPGRGASQNIAVGQETELGEWKGHGDGGGKQAASGWHHW